ncbi:MAG: diguanylate cyclase [Anaerolineales bacterium]|nr:diguanylate cyclase [Anaerolineales bacterium]
MLLVLLFLTAKFNFLLFHSLAELFSIVIAWGTFVFIWNARRFQVHDFFMVVSIAYLFIGGIDLLHTLAYKGMQIFPEGGANLPTQLWIAARYLQSSAFVIAPFFIKRTVRPSHIFIGYLLVTSLLLGTIFYWGIFPDCYIDGVGLTPFKIYSEYLISAIYLVGIFLLWKRRIDFLPEIFRLMVGSTVIAILSELAFTFYIEVQDFANIIGHFLKIASAYLVYKAVIEIGFRQPFSLLFRDLKANQEALQASQERFRTVADFTMNWEYWRAPNGNFNYVSPSCEKITGYPPQQFYQNAQIMTKVVHPDDYARFEKHVHERIQKVETVEFRIVTQAGDERWISHVCQPLFDEAGNFNGRRASNHDITERVIMEKKLKKLAITDPLTGIYNRRHFFELAEHEFERGQRYKYPLSVIILDIDHFKEVNDSHGHAVGDQVLKTFTQLCLQNIRDGDVFARIGGEEFVILQPLTYIAQCAQGADRLRKLVQDIPIYADDEPVYITISMGIAGTELEKAISLDDLINRADQALYKAKQSGRNQIMI